MKKMKFNLETPASIIVNWIDGRRSLERRRQIQRTYDELYVGEDSVNRAYYERVKFVEKLLGLGLIFLVFVILFALASIGTKSIVLDNKIQRPADLENLEVSLEWKGEGELSGSLSLIVNGIPPEGASLESLFEYGEEYIHKLIPDGEAFQGDLPFVKTIPKTGIKVKWKPEDYLYVMPDGSRTNVQLAEEGCRVKILAELSAYGEIYELEVFPLLVNPKEEEASFEEKLRELIREIESESIGAFVELPEEMDGIKLQWKEKKKSNIVYLFLIGLALFGGLFVHDFEKKRSEIKKRERQMLNDYPELVSKFLLLLEAGLTIRGVWERIVLDYKMGNQRRYAYEEMCITFREMENGISDITACEGFGKRCRLLPYLRFSNLLVQNLTKGAASVLTLLEQEAINAFEERKETAKKQGEEAGTKLLIPMVGILVIILVMIMVPAFQNI